MARPIDPRPYRVLCVSMAMSIVSGIPGLPVALKASLAGAAFILAVVYAAVLVWRLIRQLAADSRRRAAMANAQALQRQMETERGKPQPTGGRPPAEPDLAQPYRDPARRVAALEHGQRLLWQQLEAIKQSLPPNP